MKSGETLFDLFGGIRPMARAVGESPATVHGWKRNGRIPAEKQPGVLRAAMALGLAVTTADVVFPLGVPAEYLAESGTSVPCDNLPKPQKNGEAF